MGGSDIAVLLLGYETKINIMMTAALCALCSMLGSLILFSAGRLRGEWALTKLGVSTTLYAYMKGILHRGAWLFVFIAALGPPPIPKKAMVVVAGSAHVRLAVFVPFMFLGRFVRYFLIGFIGRQYGQEAMSFMDEFRMLIVITALCFVAVAVIGMVFFHLRRRNRRLSDPEADQLEEVNNLI
uniref:VTT domain-containing protein n=1 Tax=Spongospora subterranea TaxID=70186 RepID=A0A0H5RR82_9EUKA|eukprot:CRZ11229.1 hypothetical protein [Spongospora subterranea]